MMRSILCAIMIALFVLEAHSWIFPHQARSASMTRFLHPNQAKELEAHAYDLLKEALEAEADSGLSVSSAVNKAVVDKAVKQRTGPLAWCMQHLPMRGWLAGTNHSAAQDGLKP